MGLTVPCCEPYPGKTILFMSDWLYTAGVESKTGINRVPYRGRSVMKYKQLLVVYTKQTLDLTKFFSLGNKEEHSTSIR